jgi:hypothetical protein
VKSTFKGWAKPDDPIYTQGLAIISFGSPRKPSAQPSTGPQPDDIFTSAMSPEEQQAFDARMLEERQRAKSDGSPVAGQADKSNSILPPPTSAHRT